MASIRLKGYIVNNKYDEYNRNQLDRLMRGVDFLWVQKIYKSYFMLRWRNKILTIETLDDLHNFCKERGFEEVELDLKIK